MKTEKEKQPVELEAQLLKEEELEEVNGGALPPGYRPPAPRCPMCGQLFSDDDDENKEHLHACAERKRNEAKI